MRLSTYGVVSCLDCRLCGSVTLFEAPFIVHKPVFAPKSILFLMSPQVL